MSLFSFAWGVQPPIRATELSQRLLMGNWNWVLAGTAGNQVAVSGPTPILGQLFRYAFAFGPARYVARHEELQ